MDRFAEIAALPEGHRVEGYAIEALLEQRHYDSLYRVHDAAGRRYWLREFFPKEYAVREGGVVHAREVEDRNALRWWLRNFLEHGVLLSRLTHPAMERVLRAFEANGTGYWLCEAPAGERLDAVLERRGTLTEATLRRVLASVVDGLELAHGAGLLHREICPHNLILYGDDAALLTGFGVLRAPIRLKAGILHRGGTPPYAPPEEDSPSAPRGPWTDLYALGATAYHAVYGRPPVERSTIIAPPRQCSEDFLAAIAAAMQPQPEHRPQSVAEWREQLKLSPTAPSAMPEAVHSERATPATHIAKPTRRGVPFVLLLIPVALAAAALVYWRSRTQAPGSAPQPAAAAISTTSAPPPAARPVAPIAAPAENGATKTAPAAESAGTLDRLALELMAKEKKAQEARSQQQALQQQREQTTTKTVGAEAAETSAPPPSSAELEAATRAKELEQEVARLKAQQEALQKAAEARKAQERVATQRAPALTLTESAYYPAMLKKIQGAVQYPQNALRDQEEGTCTVRVAFARDGQILNAEETRRIGVLDLDRECRDVFSRLGRLPPVPANVEPDQTQFAVELPITFRLP